MQEILTLIQTFDYSAWFHQRFLNNDFLIAGLAAGLMYSFRTVPQECWKWLKFHSLSTVTIRNDDSSFYYVSIWLERHDYALKKCRRLIANFRGVSRGPSVLKQEEEKIWSGIPGYGMHLLFYKGRPVVFERITQESQGGHSGKEVRESYTFYELGRKPRAIYGILREAFDISREDEKTKIFSWLRNDEFWATVANKNLRKLETIFLPQEQKQRVIKDLQWFFENEAWFTEHGVPHHRGYLFYGQPGTGKTSFVAALAAHFNKDLSVLNLGDLRNDEGLVTAMRDLHNNSFVVIEDIDVCGAVVDRKEKPTGVSLSGLLNAIDGLATQDGMVLFMTTNVPEKIDPALLRPGRVDLKEEFHLPDAPLRRAMFLSFNPEDEQLADQFARLSEGMTPAEIQQVFMRNFKDGGGAVRDLQERTQARDAA